METLRKKTTKTAPQNFIRSCILFLSFMVLFTINVMGSGLSNQSSTPAAKDDGSAASIEQGRKDSERQMVINYILMALGLGVIFGVSWFTRSDKKKNGSADESEKHHHPAKHQHSSYEKRYGSSKIHKLRHS